MIDNLRNIIFLVSKTIETTMISHKKHRISQKSAIFKESTGTIRIHFFKTKKLKIFKNIRKI